MPPLVAVFVNYLVVNRKLSEPVLTLIRNEQKQNRISNVQLGDLKFIARFQIRQFLRELRSSLTVVFGMFIALLILMLGVDCYVLCHNISVKNKSDTKYQYMYTYKYPTKTVPKGGEACYAETLKKEVLGYDLDVTLLGINKHNKYFDFKVAHGRNKVAISNSVATKYQLSVGQKIVLTDEANDVDYAFTVDKIVPYSVGLYVFMDINSMRKLFGQEANYYNIVLSDEALNIDNGRLYSTTTKEDISKGADVFVNNMYSLVMTMIVAAIIIFIVVMYLMMKVMIDRSALNISLMKIFGYGDKEIKKLYLDGNTILVVISAVVSIPLAKKAMDSLYPYLVSNVSCGLDIGFPPQLYAEIYIGVVICYLVINRMLVGRLKKMLPAQVLKNRE
jgi:Predicted permease.